MPSCSSADALGSLGADEGFASIDHGGRATDLEPPSAMSRVHELDHPSPEDAYDRSRIRYRVASCTQMLSCGTRLARRHF